MIKDLSETKRLFVFGGFEVVKKAKFDSLKFDKMNFAHDISGPSPEDSFVSSGRNEKDFDLINQSVVIMRNCMIL